MILTVLFCVLAFTATKGEEDTPEKLLDEISSTVINDMVSTLDSKDVMTIDSALRDASFKVQQRLKAFAKLKGLTIQKAAKLVSKQVSKDKRLLEALAKRQGYEGKIATRSGKKFPQYVKNLVFMALMRN